jgi:muconolactone delta-isomerase
MRDFMVTINVSNIDNETMSKLRPKEAKVLIKWALNGTLKSPYVRADLSGAFLVLRGENIAHINSLMETLPMFPYMKIEITELEHQPFVMRLAFNIFLTIGSLVKAFTR